MADLFKEILPSILENKESVMLNDADERSYPAFMVNRALSYHRDTVLIANEMNKYSSLDNKIKYHFLLYTVRSQKRRYTKWFKKSVDNDLSAVKEYYGYSDAKAYEALKILDDAQITEIKKRVYKGD